MAWWLGRRLGDVAFLLLAGRRRVVMANLATAFPDLAPGARRRLARRSFQHLGLVVVESCALLARPVGEILARVRIDGLEHLHAAMACHGRAILLTAHLGNWEYLALSHRLTPYRLSTLARPLDSSWLEQAVRRLREKAGVAVIDKRRALRPMLRALGEGGLVAVLLDQNASRHEGVFVPFFGRLASTSRGLALVALRSGAPVLPVFIRRESAGLHRVQVSAPVPVAAIPDRDLAVQDLTARCTLAVEAAIRESPDQWLWIHRRWRTRPVAERPSR